MYPQGTLKPDHRAAGKTRQSHADNLVDRAFDAVFIGGALGVAVGSAQLLQNSLMEMIDHKPRVQRFLALRPARLQGEARCALLR